MSGAIGGSYWGTASLFIPDGNPTVLTPTSMGVDLTTGPNLRPYNAVWWVFTPPINGFLELHTYDTPMIRPDEMYFDTYLTVWAGGVSEDSASLYASNDDTDQELGDPYVGASYLYIGVTAGVTLHIKLGGYQNIPDENNILAYVLTGIMYDDFGNPVSGTPSTPTAVGNVELRRSHFYSKP